MEEEAESLGNWGNAAWVGVGLERFGQQEIGQEGAETRNAGGGAHCIHEITYPCIAAAFIETPIEITQKASHPQTVATS